MIILEFSPIFILGSSVNSNNEILEALYDNEYTQYQIASMFHVPYELLAYKIMLLEHKGYNVPKLPEIPKSNFLSSSLGMNSDWECYYTD